MLYTKLSSLQYKKDILQMTCWNEFLYQTKSVIDLLKTTSKFRKWRGKPLSTWRENLM